MFQYAAHEARRAAVLAAAMRIIATAGTAALTVSRVSEASGMPMSTYRYLFPSQHVLRAQVLEEIAESIRGRTVGVDPGDLIRVLLPDIAARREEAIVVHALGAEAIVDPEIRGAWRDVDEAITDTCEAALHAAGARPQPSDVLRLRTLVDGVTAWMLLSDDPEAVTEARRLLDEALLDATASCFGAPSVRAAA